MSPAARGPAGRLLPALLALLAAASAGCEAITAHRTVQSAREGAARAARGGSGPIERAFEAEAERTRDEIEAARRAAEALLSGRVEKTRREAERAREEARRALERGSEVLGQAARDGGRAAEGWARLIQDRMMRLEESLQALSGAGEHADS